MRWQKAGLPDEVQGADGRRDSCAASALVRDISEELEGQAVMTEHASGD